MKSLFYAMVLLFSLTLVAQQAPDKEPTGGKPAAGTPGGGTMTRNVAELDKFAKIMLGTWAVQESHDASDMMPAGTSSGIATFRKGPGGYSVIENLSMNGSFGKFTGLGVTWYDLKNQAYKGTWCDSMTPACDSSFTGKWEGEKLVSSGFSEMPDGKKMFMRDEHTDITPDSFTFTMYGGPDENSLKKFMTMKYTRKSGPPAATKPDAKK